MSDYVTERRRPGTTRPARAGPAAEPASAVVHPKKPARSQAGEGQPIAQLTIALNQSPRVSRLAELAGRLHADAALPSGVVQRVEGEEIGTLIARPSGEGGEILSPEESARFRRERRLEAVEARRRASEAGVAGTLIARAPGEGGEVLPPEESARFRRDRRLEAVEARRRTFEGEQRDPLIAQAPGAGGRILPPDAFGKQRTRAGRVKAPMSPESAERERLERIAQWERQVKVQRARQAFDAARSLAEQALTSTIHKPASLPGRLADLGALWASGDHDGVLTAAPVLAALAQGVIDADLMHASIRARTAELPPVTDKEYGVYRRNMEQWLAEHVAKAWEQQSRSDGLQRLNTRVFEYVSTIASRREATARGDAAVDEARKQGRIAADGTIIDRKRITSFPAEEQQAINEALAALSAPALVTWPGKWGEDHGNYEGRLPGTPGAGNYREYYVRKGPHHTAPGPRRFCVNRNHKIFYSNTHYGQSGSPAFYAIGGW